MKEIQLQEYDDEKFWVKSEQSQQIICKFIDILFSDIFP